MDFLKKFSIFQYAVVVLLILNGVWLFISYKNVWGFDLMTLCKAARQLYETGDLYDNSGYYNLPLSIAIIFPYIFFNKFWLIKVAIQALCVLGGVLLIFKIIKDDIANNYEMIFLLVCILLTFVFEQFISLNVYLEVMILLMLSIYFYLKDNETLSAFFLSMAITIKIFLLPLMLVPLLTKEYGLVKRLSVFLLLFSVLSLAVFGIDAHLDFIRALLEYYPQKRLEEIKHLFVSSLWGGYQDFYNKLFVMNRLSREGVAWLTSITAFLYFSIIVYLSRIISRKSRSITSENGRKEYYIKVFGSFMVLSLAFNFRYDHGAMLLAILPFIAKINDPGIRKKISCSIIITGFSAIGCITLLELTGFFEARTIENLIGFFDVFSFTFIGINLVLIFLIIFWLKIHSEPA